MLATRGFLAELKIKLTVRRCLVIKSDASEWDGNMQEIDAAMQTEET